MIDIKQLRQDPNQFKRSAQLRGLKVDIDKTVDLADKYLKSLQDVEQRRGELKLDQKPDAEQLKQFQAKKAELEKVEQAHAALWAQLEAALMDVPNLLAPDTPEGDEEANRQERVWGEAKSRPEAKDHLTLGEEQGWLDFERGAKTSGSKFYFVKGALVKLELAVTRWVLDHLESKGFMPMMVPHLVNGRAAGGTGFLPRGEEKQLYRVEGEDLYLIATAEMPLAAYHAEEIIDPQKLPLSYAGISPSYRMEAGAYGKHSKGLYRVHQFDKVEMYVYCLPEDSESWHERLLAIEEEICQALNIPYRVVRIAAGDLGAPAFKKYDIEYWSPVENQYRELMSCSNVTDYQARRLGLRTRIGGKTQYLHTLNATAAAMSRILIAIMENYQTTDGAVEVPEVLKPYYGGSKL